MSKSVFGPLKLFTVQLNTTKILYFIDFGVSRIIIHGIVTQRGTAIPAQGGRLGEALAALAARCVREGAQGAASNDLASGMLSTHASCHGTSHFCTLPASQRMYVAGFLFF